jgi:hypothetical protein
MQYFNTTYLCINTNVIFRYYQVILQYLYKKAPIIILLSLNNKAQWHVKNVKKPKKSFDLCILHTTMNMNHISTFKQTNIICG